MSNIRMGIQAIIDALKSQNANMTKTDITNYIVFNNTYHRVTLSYDPGTNKVFIPQLDYQLTRLLNYGIIKRSANKYSLKYGYESVLEKLSRKTV